MARKVTLAHGYFTKKPIDLEEGYLVQLEGNGPRFMIMANITQEQMLRVFLEMHKQLEGPLEWFAECFDRETNKEKEYRLTDLDRGLLSRLEEDLDFFLQDGLTQIGCYSKQSKDEFYFGRLGILYVYTSDIKRFKSAFKALAIPQKSQLNTLWYCVKNEGVEVEERSLKKAGKGVLDLLLPLGFAEKKG